jgi:hypothetical protein
VRGNCSLEGTVQISSNTTGMAADLCVATDKSARDLCVVVVKGTFHLAPRGQAVLAEQQEPLVYADVHHGEPGSTSLRYESDFAPFKPRADILINAQAVSPMGKPVEEVLVTVELGPLRKALRVVGERRWERGFWGLRPSPAVPFLSMPLVYERAFGGVDRTHPEPRYQGAELRNPVGVGYRKNPQAQATEGTLLPNLEDPRHPLSDWRDTPAPAGLSAVGRGWQPRLAHAGTYDQRWLEEQAPFLPQDFDEQYFLCAPEDQQVPYLRGGEVLRCMGLTRGGPLLVRVPELRFPVHFHFDKGEQVVEPRLDTLLLEPEQQRLLLTWRAQVPLGHKPEALREVRVGHQPVRLPPGRGRGKRYFKSLGELVAWRSQQRRGGRP